MSEAETETKGQKPKISKLSILGFVIFALIASIVSLAWLLRLTDRAKTRLVYMVICRANLSGLGRAMLIYANDYDDQYPTADKWCDLLIMHSEVYPRLFVCKLSDAKEGESSYAMNKNVVGKKVTEVPKDVVVLFETNFGKSRAGRQELLRDRGFYKFFGEDIWSFGKKTSGLEKVYELRWNQFGGPEILTTENHRGKGCNVLFNNGRVEFVKVKRLGELKWEVEQNNK
jgi:hypothetical protein